MLRKTVHPLLIPFCLGLFVMATLMGPGTASATVIGLFESRANSDAGGVTPIGNPYSGTLTITYNPGAGSHFYLGYFDFEINEAVNTFFNEKGGTGGTPTAGQSWEIDEPGFVFGNIYDNFLANALDNSIGTPDPDDVAMAIGWNFTLATDEYAVITFTASLTAPVSGFYLSQHDVDSGETLYLQGKLDVRGGGTPIPEPGTIMLLGSGLAAVLAYRNRRRQA